MVCSISGRNRKSRVFVLALAYIALNGIGVAQEPAPSTQTPTIKVQVQQVLVPVVVTDRKGHFITDLKASDFQVFEDGVEQKLVSFSTHEDATPEQLQPDIATPAPHAGEAAPVAAATSDSRPRHTYLIVMDTLNSSLAGSVYTREALKKLFKNEQGVDTQYALIAVGRTTVVIQNLTSDPKVVLAALEKKEFSKSIVSSEASNLTEQENDLRQQLEQHCAPSEANKHSDTGCGPYMPGILTLAKTAADERDRLTRNFLIVLRSLTEQLSGMPGRRVLIVASDGFSMQPGRSLFEMIASFTDQIKYTSYNPTSYLSTEISGIARLATSRNVTFYTLDSRGLSAEPGIDISDTLIETRNQAQDLAKMTSNIETSAMEKQDPMNFLAQATGGIFYHNSNDLLKGFRQAIADGRSYYELAYESSNPAIDGKFHAIKVEVKGKDFIVRAKPGYWASAINNPTIIATTGAAPLPPAAPAPAANIPSTPRPAPVVPLARTASFVDMPTGELVRLVPELKNLEPAANQDGLASILQKVGANVATLFANFPNVASREQVHEQRSMARQSVDTRYVVSPIHNDDIYHDYRYVALENSDRNQNRLEEYRTDTKGRLVTSNGADNGFMITKGFVSTPVFFDPAHQQESKFRYLGQEAVDKRATYVVAFAQLPSAQVKEQIATGNGGSVFVLTQGLAWIDPDNYQIIRMWTGLMSPIPEINLQGQSTRVNFAEVHFRGMASGLWLPSKVQVETKLGDLIFRNSHTYSDFKLFSVDTEERQPAPASP
jgi:VWFA-related protein